MKNKIEISKLFPSMIFTWNYIYLLVILFCGIVIIEEKVVLGSVILGIFFLLVISQIIHIQRKKDEVVEYIHSLVFHMHSDTNDVFMDLPLPYVVIDLGGNIRWYNVHFEEIVSETKILGKNICSIISELSTQLFEKQIKSFIKDIKFNDQYFKAHIELIETKKENGKNTPQYVYTIYFVETTEYIKLKKQYQEEKPALGLIYIDNYDEVMGSIEDTRRPLLLAVIDKKVTAMAQQVEGVIKKYERDKYIILFPNKYIQFFEKNKFEILDQVRSVDIGNSIPVTLSMGVGINGISYIENLAFANNAIDLALGRGGDQAIIKDKDKVIFFGGKTKEVEKSTKVKARVKSYALRELILSADKVIVMGHKNLDIDCLGSAIGISRAAKAFHIPSHIILTNITLGIEAIYQRMMESGKYEDLFIDVDRAKEIMTDRTLLVIVDVHRPNYTECEELIHQCKNVVVIDHHRKSVEFIENAVLTYLEPYASSTSELVTEILQYITDKIKLESIEADALLAGIAVDTKNFVFKTGVRTFEAASFLRRSGADSTKVRMLYKNDMETYRAKSSIVSTAEIYKENVAISSCPRNTPNPIIVAAQAADELLNIQGVQASFVMVDTEEKIMISGRSLGDMNVQVILEKLGGGGHMTVAGAQLKDKSINEVKGLLKNAIDQYIEEGEK